MEILELERGLSNEPKKLAGFGIPLYSYPSIPYFLQGNPHITDGYRVHLAPKLCVKSAFILSNETVNIWSHFLGLICFVILQFYDVFYYLPGNGAQRGDYFIFIAMNLCFQVCLFCSTGYHMFLCQSEVAYQRWFRVDLIGISIAMFGCYFPGAYYAFYCNQFWQSAYMLMMFVMMAVSILAQAHPQYLANEWQCRRVALYSVLVFAGVIPILHWVLQNGGLGGQFVQLFMPKILIMYVLVTTAGLFYISHFPERICPGKVNIFCSSHQWWHLMVFLVFVWAHHMAVVVFTYWRTHICSLPTHANTDSWNLYSFLGIKV